MSAEKIGDIKEQLKNTTDSQLGHFIEAYGSDDRGGVIKLVDSAKKRLDKYEKKFYHDNKDIIDIKTRLSEEEQAYKDRLNEMLNLK